MSVFLEKYANHQSRFLAIDHSLVHYKDEGHGPVLLMVHGIFASLHTWDGWVDQLLGEYRMIRLDLPGFGLSQVTEDHKYSMDRYIHTINELMDDLGIYRFSIAGNSLGGWLAWEYAVDHPDRIEKLILIDSAGVEIGRNIPMPVRLARLPFASKLTSLFIRRPVIEHFIKEVYGDASRIKPGVIERYFELFAREGNPEAFLTMVNAPFVDRTDELPDIKAPTLIIWGEKDNWLPISNGYHLLNMIPEAQLIVYEDLGHVPMEEAPEDTAEDVRAFLSETAKVDLPEEV